MWYVVYGDLRKRGGDRNIPNQPAVISTKTDFLASHNKRNFIAVKWIDMYAFGINLCIGYITYNMHFYMLSTLLVLLQWGVYAWAYIM